MEKPTRPWDPNAPSLLWAHEIRRENIQLVNQLDNTRADLATATDTIDGLKQKIDELTQRLHDENNVIHNSLQQLEARFDTMLGSMRERIECLESENRRLRTRLDITEQECSKQAREQYRMEEDIRTRILDEVRTSLERIPGVLKMHVPRAGQTSPGSDVLVPDSMPMDSAPVANPDVLRTLSDTTWGSYTQVEASLASVVNKGYTEELSLDLDTVMKQGGRSLAEYLSAAEGMTPRLHLQNAEEEILGAFVRGLDDLDVQILIEKEMSRVGWTWSAMRAILQAAIRVREAPIKVDKTADRGVKQNNVDHVKSKQRKTRRFIPIVPADEEDDLFVMEMFRH
ncbi:hypothetical protein BO94DRAFT_550656 [Aspergillus sclerotioniger CBS 115572]|uniref:Uncharacterized protein n=1 Tax=Aspergillus sclerotioniger CBS 115572 TaxID=1450535 RepID=A0A317VB95_9EURO|nr:hypothetical protein BO94DRAFT_550656 [Aspergillus sclerotioniger CBS 115572]PWY70347.1 hypothetical protein BO94DRAFT_550656 [Aspergillus sclerotioniger CBS 115572]